MQSPAHTSGFESCASPFERSSCAKLFLTHRSCACKESGQMDIVLFAVTDGTRRCMTLETKSHSAANKEGVDDVHRI